MYIYEASGMEATSVKGGVRRRLPSARLRDALGQLEPPPDEGCEGYGEAVGSRSRDFG